MSNLPFTLDQLKILQTISTEGCRFLADSEISPIFCGMLRKTANFEPGAVQKRANLID